MSEPTEPVQAHDPIKRGDFTVWENGYFSICLEIAANTNPKKTKELFFRADGTLHDKGLPPPDLGKGSSVSGEGVFEVYAKLKHMMLAGSNCTTNNRPVRTDQVKYLLQNYTSKAAFEKENLDVYVDGYFSLAPAA